jgi:hypothetical protein
MDDRFGDALAGNFDLVAARARIALDLAHQARGAVYGGMHALDDKDRHCKWEKETQKAEECQPNESDVTPKCQVHGMSFNRNYADPVYYGCAMMNQKHATCLHIQV